MVLFFLLILRTTFIVGIDQRLDDKDRTKILGLIHPVALTTVEEEYIRTGYLECCFSIMIHHHLKLHQEVFHCHCVAWLIGLFLCAWDATFQFLCKMIRLTRKSHLNFMLWIFTMFGIWQPKFYHFTLELDSGVSSTDLLLPRVTILITFFGSFYSSKAPRYRKRRTSPLRAVENNLYTSRNGTCNWSPQSSSASWLDREHGRFTWMSTCKNESPIVGTVHRVREQFSFL